jgi:hypothetical protein
MRSFWAIAALVIGLASLGSFGAAVASGYVWGSPTERFVPAGVRASSGGYRSFHFWHAGYGGYRGGK